MLKFEFTDINDEKIIKKSPVSLVINMEEDTPADDMVVDFEYFESEELKEVKVLDKDEVVFFGVVDEQSVVVSKNGKILRIVSRSMAAKLLDNESMPVSYNYPSARLIEDSHLKPFGLVLKNDKDSTYFGTQTVLKGSTNYQAVADFSKNVYSTYPRVNALGEVELTQTNKKGVAVFSNTKEGIKYRKLTQTLKRCEEISKVHIKVMNSSGYNHKIENSDALKRGIQRERYISAVMTDNPAQCAQKMIENGRKKAYQVTLECVGRYLDVFKCDALIADCKLKYDSPLYVSSLRYQQNFNSELTIIILKRKEV